MKRIKRAINVVTFLLIYTSVLSASEIHDAARRGDLGKIKLLISNNPQLINEKDDEGDIPLCTSILNKHVEISIYFIEKGADINNQNQDGYSPLHWAAVAGEEVIAKALLDKGVDPNIQTYEGMASLHFAGVRGYTGLMNILIDEGADLELKNARDRTPLLYISREGGNYNAIKLLLDRGADINARDAYDDSSLTLATWRGYEEIVNMFLDEGLEFSVSGMEGQHLLTFASSNGLEKLFSSLLEANINIKRKLENNNSVLHQAVSGGSSEIIDKLFEKSPDINARNIFGWTPLHVAVKEGNTDIVLQLIDNKADINARTRIGETAYNIAQNESNNLMMDILVKNAASTEAVQFPILSGKYIDNQLPDLKTSIFAPGIVSTQEFSHSPPAFSRDGKEVVFCRSVVIDGGYTRSVLKICSKKNGVWQMPEDAPFSSDFGDGEPFFSDDGKRLFFLSRRPLDNGESPIDENIWYVDRTEDGWSEPFFFNEIINQKEIHWQFSMDENNSVYIGSSSGGGYGENDIYVSKFEDGRYTAYENLGEAINTE